MSYTGGAHVSRSNPFGFLSNLKDGLLDAEEHSVDSSIPEDVESVRTTRESLKPLTTLEFYQKEGWFAEMCEILFKLKRRKATIKDEMYFGLIHFISCMYVLAVVPQQMVAAGYAIQPTVVSVALCSGVGSICCGLFANLPFVLAPPTVVSIFLSLFLQQNGITAREGSVGVMISGFFLIFFAYRPFGDFIKRMIPLPIQVGTAVGIGLLTTFAGSTEIDFVTQGQYSLLKMGKITSEIVIAFFGVYIICMTLRYHIKGSFAIAVIICSLTWWIYSNDFPDEIAAAPVINFEIFNGLSRKYLPIMTVDLFFLYVLYLNGLLTSLGSLGTLQREDGTIPRVRWVYILSGVMCIVAGLCSAPPILVSPESSAAIKEGAKTGLSTVVAGLLFLFSMFFSPVFEYVPSAGTSPVLIMIGLILFQNVSRVDWRNLTDAAPAFVVLFYIPFTYSIIQGVILGYILYLSISLSTGDLLIHSLRLLFIYFPSTEEKLMKYKWLQPHIATARLPSRNTDAHLLNESIASQNIGATIESATIYTPALRSSHGTDEDDPGETGSTGEDGQWKVAGGGEPRLARAGSVDYARDTTDNRGVDLNLSIGCYGAASDKAPAYEAANFGMFENIDEDKPTSSQSSTLPKQRSLEQLPHSRSRSQKAKEREDQGSGEGDKKKEGPGGKKAGKEGKVEGGAQKEGKEGSVSTGDSDSAGEEGIDEKTTENEP